MDQAGAIHTRRRSGGEDSGGVSRSTWELRNTTPEQGEHTDAILGELGYGAAEIAGLREKKVV